MLEYRALELPEGIVPPKIGLNAVLTMELNELAADGWRVTAANRTGPGLTKWHVIMEREANVESDA